MQGENKPHHQRNTAHELRDKSTNPGRKKQNATAEKPATQGAQKEAASYKADLVYIGVFALAMMVQVAVWFLGDNAFFSVLFVGCVVFLIVYGAWQHKDLPPEEKRAYMRDQMRRSDKIFSDGFFGIGPYDYLGKRPRS